MNPFLPAGGRLSFLEGGVAQVAFLVDDLDQAVENYYRTFGVGPWHFYTYRKPFVPRMSYRGGEADYAMRIALSYFGDTRVEFIQSLRGPSIYEEFIERHGYGVQHLGFLVENMEAALAEAQGAGFEMIQDGAGFGPDGDGHYAYIESEGAFGITFELIERPRGRKPPERIYPEE
jgi:catechol 2,3-dioxygenase-like lactoylglutathione lyase family enzyme